MRLCSGPTHDPSHFPSPLLRAEDFYLAQYNATRRRSVDTGGLALALRDDGSTYKTSWGGWGDPQHVSIPYAEMLSRLYMQTMPSSCLPNGSSSSTMSPATRLRLIRTTGSWAFDSLSLSEDDLFNTSCLIFDVLFTVEGASDEIGIQAHQLRPFLQAMRSVYSHDNTYHNYQHAVDVLQAMYAFLTDAGCIPPISVLESSRALVSPRWKRASAPHGTLKDILNNVDVFMLFVAALGHDAGHPGLNNGFMKCAGTCLSALFDHTSTLERMHCTLLLQLMRNFGLGHLITSDNIILGAASKSIRSTLVDTVLATDMSLHFRWIKDFSDLIDERGPLDTGFDSQTDEGKRRVKLLACQALMKCADISNPVRPHTISEAWSRALMHEWYAQATLERSMALPTSVPSNVPPPIRPSIFTPPEDPGTSSSHQQHTASAGSPSYDDQLNGWDATEVTAAKEQVKGQVSFIDVFTAPLYAALARFAPELAHFYARCTQNRQLWEAKMSELTELEGELALTSATSGSDPDGVSVDSIADAMSTSSPPSEPLSPSPTPPTSARVSSEQDTRSSIDSAHPLFSPGMMTDFSFGGGRRTSATTIASSVMSMNSSTDEVEPDMTDLESTPKALKGTHTQPPSPFEPFLRHSRHMSTMSTMSAVSGTSSYYTARSHSEDSEDWDAEDAEDADQTTSWTTTKTIPLLMQYRLGHAGGNDEWRLGSASSLRTIQNPASMAFAAHVGISPHSSSGFGINHGGSGERNVRFDDGDGSAGLGARETSPGSPNAPDSPTLSEHMYRAPLGMESMRAAYRASARKQANSYYGFYGDGDDDVGHGPGELRGLRGLGSGEYPYRRRSAGNVGPYIRPLAVR